MCLSTPAILHRCGEFQPALISTRPGEKLWRRNSGVQEWRQIIHAVIWFWLAKTNFHRAGKYDLPLKGFIQQVEVNNWEIGTSLPWWLLGPVTSSLPFLLSLSALLNIKALVCWALNQQCESSDPRSFAVFCCWEVTAPCRASLLFVLPQQLQLLIQSNWCYFPVNQWVGEARSVCSRELFVPSAGYGTAWRARLCFVCYSKSWEHSALTCWRSCSWEHQVLHQSATEV